MSGDDSTKKDRKIASTAYVEQFKPKMSKLFVAKAIDLIHDGKHDDGTIPTKSLEILCDLPHF